MKRGIVALPVAALLLVSAAAAAGDTFLGVVKKVEKDGSLEVKQGSKAVRVVPTPGKTEVLRLARDTTFATMKPGTIVFVLGSKEKERTDPQTHQLVAVDRIERIQAIVAGEGFLPPRVPADVQGVQWHSGYLVRRDNEALLDGHVLLWGRDKPFFSLGSGALTDIAKGKAISIDGAREGRGKDTTLRATRIVIVPADLTALEQKLLFGR
jgi:hypothetical protein